MEIKQQINTLERLTMRALPAKEVYYLEGWYLRYTAGFTKRANSIYPLEMKRHQLENDIQSCEKWYEEHDFPAVFKMTEAAVPAGLDNFLQEKNYTKQDETSVQVLPYESYVSEPVDVQIRFDDVFHERWFEHVCRFNMVDECYTDVFRQLLLRIEARVCYALVVDENETILSCGLGVLDDGYFGLYDIVTNPDYRNCGLGRKLVHGLLQWGQTQGAHTAYLQVVKDNAPARHLYDKIGFEEAYTYWYRIKDKEV